MHRLLTLLVACIAVAGCTEPTDAPMSVADGMPRASDLPEGLEMMDFNTSGGRMLARMFGMEANPGEGDPNPQADGGPWGGTTPPIRAYYAFIDDARPESHEDDGVLWMGFEFVDAQTAATSLAEADVCKPENGREIIVLTWHNAAIVYDFDGDLARSFSASHQSIWTGAEPFC